MRRCPTSGRAISPPASAIGWHGFKYTPRAVRKTEKTSQSKNVRNMRHISTLAPNAVTLCFTALDSSSPVQQLEEPFLDHDFISVDKTYTTLSHCNTTVMLLARLRRWSTSPPWRTATSQAIRWSGRALSITREAVRL